MGRRQEKDDVELWWRAEDKRYANYDPWAEFDQPSGSHLVIELHRYEVERHTPKGVIIAHHGFVRGKARKQFAVPTQELALQDLIIRKKYHVDGCKARLARAEEHLRAAEHELQKLRRVATQNVGDTHALAPGLPVVVESSPAEDPQAGAATPLGRLLL
jgi:hypothetical protein